MLYEAIKEILEEVVTPFICPGKVFPIFGTEFPCITYTITPASGGVVKEDQVEIKIIHPDYEIAEEIKKAICDKLNTELNKPSLVSNNVALRGQLAGGGSLFSDGPQMWELSQFFIITWRCL